MTAAHYKGGHPPGNDLGLHYTALPPIVGSCPYSDQLLVTRKFWSPGANRPSQVSELLARFSYLGSDRSDIAVWRCAETASIANASTRLVRRISNTHKLEIEIPRRPGLSLAVARAF